jgi:hypothetical protein
MSEKRVEEKVLLRSHLGDEFAHEIVTFCFEDIEGSLVLHVVLDWELGGLGLKQNILQLQS